MSCTKCISLTKPPYTTNSNIIGISYTNMLLVKGISVSATASSPAHTKRILSAKEAISSLASIQPTSYTKRISPYNN